MTVCQLAEAIVIEPGDAKTDESAQLFNPCEVIGICGSLVTTAQSASGEGVDDPGRMLVGFAHYSVKEFLVSDRIKASSARRFSLDQVDGRVYVTTINLTFLTFERYKLKSFLWRSIYPTEDFLYEHAAHEWISHAMDPAVEAQIIPYVLQLLTPTDSNQLLTWQTVTKRCKESPLYTAIEQDLLLIAEELLKAGADPNDSLAMENGSFWKDTPLTFAVSLRRKRVIKLLLQGGADPHAENFYGQTPLWLALDGDLKSWLEAGGTPFGMAGRPDPLEVFLDRLQGMWNKFVGHGFRSAKDEQSALILLEKRIQCGVTSFSEKLMYGAACAGSATFIAVLLQRGTDPNLQHDGKTPLEWVMRKLNDFANRFRLSGWEYFTSGQVKRLLEVAMLLLENGGNLSTVSCRSRISYSSVKQLLTAIVG